MSNSTLAAHIHIKHFTFSFEGWRRYCLVLSGSEQGRIQVITREGTMFSVPDAALREASPEESKITPEKALELMAKGLRVQGAKRARRRQAEANRVAANAELNRLLGFDLDAAIKAVGL